MKMIERKTGERDRRERKRGENKKEKYKTVEVCIIPWLAKITTLVTAL